MLIACYNIYNEIKYLPESVASIYDKVDKIIFVDGRYRDFYKDKPVKSTDGTLQWIKDKKNDPKSKFHLVKAQRHGWKNQAVKRSAYLIGSPGDMYLIIDGHEIITDWRRPEILMGALAFARCDHPDNDSPISVKAPKIIVQPERKIKYETHSYIVYDDDEGGLYMNAGWDHQSVMPPEQFDKKISWESYCFTLTHRGKQKKGSDQRLLQVAKEREKVLIYDEAHNLNFKVDARLVVERMTDIYLPHFKQRFLAEGIRPPTDARRKLRKIIELKAREVERHLIAQRENRGIASKQVICPDCGFISNGGAMNLMEHYAREHGN